MKRIYLDHNATTPVRPEVFAAAVPFIERHFGNPSSVHWAGSEVREAVETARARVAALLGADPREIVFTSGGSESNNLALKGVLGADGSDRRHLVITAVEHPSVIETAAHLEADGARVTVVGVDGSGSVAPEAIEKAITPETGLVSVMYANNETGTILPLAAIGKICRARGVPFHSDAVQAIGKIPIDLASLQVDLLSLAGHKFNAFKGIGALYVRGGMKISRQIDGGPQERRRRAGTENVAGYVSLGAAARLAEAEVTRNADQWRKLRDHLWEGILSEIPDVRLNGHPTDRLPNTLNVSFAGADSQAVLMGLDLEGIAVSSGSACATGSIEPSDVLLAMGIDEASARSSIRFSLGWENTMEDVEHTLSLLPEIVARARRASPASRPGMAAGA